MFCKFLNNFVLLNFLLPTVFGVPVLFWNVKNVPLKPVFPKIPPEEFKMTMYGLIDTKMPFVVFTIDYLPHSAFLNAIYWPHLSNVTDMVYYANVVDPVDVFTEGVNGAGAEIIEAEVDNDGDVELIYECKPDIYKIKLGAFINKRPKILEYDTAISRVSKGLEATAVNNSCEAIYALISSVPPPPPVEEPILTEYGNGSIHASSRLVCYISKIKVRPINEIAVKIDVANMAVVEQPNILSVTLFVNDTDEDDNKNEPRGNSTIVFDVKIANGYFKIEHFIYKNMKFYAFYLEAPVEQSYSCSSLTLINGNFSLIFEGFQLQTREGSENNDTENFQFNDPWDCVGFSSTGIMSGIAVSSLLIAIIAMGAVPLFNMNGPNRFDDSNRPTIQVITSD